MSIGRGASGLVTVEDAIRTRRSVTHLTGEVDAQTVDAILELAVWAPNHHLTQPWSFIVVAGAGRDRLAAVWADEVRRQQDITSNPDVVEKVVAAESKKVYRAPILVFAAVRPPTGNSVTDLEDFAATAAAVQNILLAAHAKGLGAIWRTGKMSRNEAVKECLGLERNARIVAIIYLGRVGKPAVEQLRSTDVVRWFR